MRSFLVSCVFALGPLSGVLFGQCSSPWCNPGGVLQEVEGTTVLETYFSAIHGKNIQYKIHLPQDYGNDPDRQYPLILLLPGYGSTEVYTDYFVQFVARMAAGTFPRSVLVVLNPIGNAFWHDASQSTGTAVQVQGYSTVINEMIPHLEATYRIGTEKANRALVGFSMGGYGALNLGLRSNLFSSVTSFDGAIRVVGNESAQLQYSCYNSVPQTTQHNLFTVLAQHGSAAQQTFIHLLVSTNGNADQGQFHDELNTLGAAHRFEDVSGTAHAWADMFAVREDTTFKIIKDHLVVPVSSVSVNVKVFLQGPYDPLNGTMSATLGSSGTIPTTEPYTALGHTFIGGGGESAVPAVLHVTGQNAITDWVIIELRNKNNPSQILGSRCALLRNDGIVVDIDGSEQVTFNMPEDDYFIAIRHRNHLGIMSSAPQPLHSVSALVDLTLFPGNIHGIGVGAAVNVGGRYCMWSGDVTHNGIVKYIGGGNDRDPILVGIGGVLPTNTITGYRNEDIDLDGVVKYIGPVNDRDPILVNIGGTLPTATVTQQLP